MCWKALLGGLFRSPPSTTWPSDCSRLADGRRVQPVQSGISIQAFHKIRIQVLATHRPPHSQDTEASIRFKISVTGRVIIGQVAWTLHTNHSLWIVVHLGLGRCCCWPTGTCARAPAAGGEPSLPGPHNSASKGAAPCCAADRSCPSPSLSSTPPPTPFFFFVGQVGAERPRLCTLTRIAVSSAVPGCSWLTSWSAVVVRRDLCGARGPRLVGGWQPHSQPKSVAVSRQSYRELKSRLRNNRLQS